MNVVVPVQIENAPPHSVEAEQGVLGSMLLAPSEATPKVVEKINAEHFYVPAHRQIFDTLIDFFDAGKAIDLITFTQALRDRNLLESVGGAAAVTHLYTFVPDAANVAYYIDIVQDKYALRQIIRACTETLRQANESQVEPSELVDQIESTAASIRALHGRNGQFPPIADAAELIAKPIILPDDVIEGIAHLGGKMVVAGASKTFKTWLLCDTAISVASGTDWLGFPTKRGRVLYINLEIQSGFFARRIQAICDERQIKIETGMLKIWNLRGHAADLSTLMPRLLRAIKPGEFVLIIIDPVYKLLGQRDENKAGDIATLLNQVERLAVETSAAVAFGAHYPKGNVAARESIDRIGGSGVFARDPDTILNFTRHEQEDCFTVEATLRNHPPVEPFVVRWEYPLFMVDDSLDPFDLKKAGRKPETSPDDVLDVLAKPLTEAEWRELARTKLGISRRTFERRLEVIETKKTAVFQNDKWHRTSS
jgi:hypothetical protein